MTQKVGDVREEVLERLSASSIKTFIDSLVGDGNARIVPHSVGRQQAPNGEATGGTMEDTQEKGGPQEEGREDTWASWTRGREVFRDKVSKESL